MKWQKVKLGRIVNNLDSKRKPLNDIERSKISVHGLYPYIGANNIMGYVDEFLFNEDILCVAEDGGNWGADKNCAIIYSGKTWVNNHAHVLTAKKGTDLRYLKYYFNHADLNRYITGSTRGKLTKTSLESIEIPLPPLNIQEEIADTLDRADALRRKDQELLQKYDEFTQAIFFDMFGDPFVDKSDWPSKSIREIIRDDIQNIPKNPDFDEISYIDISSIDNQKKRITTLKKISTNEAPSRAKQKVSKGDILVSTVRPNLNAVAVVESKLRNLIASTGFCVLRPNSALSTTEFLFGLVRTRKFIDRLVQQATGASYPAVTDNIIKSIQVAVPPIELQKQFSLMIENLMIQIDHLERASNSSEMLMSALLKQFYS